MAKVICSKCGMLSDVVVCEDCCTENTGQSRAAMYAAELEVDKLTIKVNGLEKLVKELRETLGELKEPEYAKPDKILNYRIGEEVGK